MFLPSDYRVGQKHTYGFGAWSVLKFRLVTVTSAKIEKLNTEVQDKGKWDFSQILATFRWKSNLNVVHSAFEEALVQLPISIAWRSLLWKNTQKVSS